MIWYQHASNRDSAGVSKRLMPFKPKLKLDCKSTIIVSSADFLALPTAFLIMNNGPADKLYVSKYKTTDITKGFAISEECKGK